MCHSAVMELSNNKKKFKSVRDQVKDQIASMCYSGVIKGHCGKE